MRFEVIVAFGDVTFADVILVFTIEVLTFFELCEDRWISASITRDIVIEPAGIARNSRLKFGIFSHVT
ncbi:MAG: hypothetical protein CMN63_04110 [Sphingobium sp.]|nr:hypothetical protein [Sphingobium sp.]